MSASTTKSERLLQRMNRRTENTAASVDEGIEQKRDILDTIVGSNHDNHSQMASDLDNLKEQVTVTSYIDNSISQDNEIINKNNSSEQSSFTNTLGPKNFAQEMASIAEQVAQEAKARKTKRETHKQVTYQLPKELLKRFDRIAQRNKDVRGFKEKTVQRLIEEFCDAMEAKQKKR